MMEHLHLLIEESFIFQYISPILAIQGIEIRSIFDAIDEEECYCYLQIK